MQYLFGALRMCGSLLSSLKLQRLMLRMLEECSLKQDEFSDLNIEIYRIWKEELDWNEALIKRYIGREALWLHRRFLSLCWARHIASNMSYSRSAEQRSGIDNGIDVFMENELCLVNSFSTIPDSYFEDFQAQATYSATYLLWLTKQIPKSPGMGVQDNPNLKGLKAMLNIACPERSSLWSI